MDAEQQAAAGVTRTPAAARAAGPDTDRAVDAARAPGARADRTEAAISMRDTKTWTVRDSTGKDHEVTAHAWRVRGGSANIFTRNGVTVARFVDPVSVVLSEKGVTP